MKSFLRLGVKWNLLDLLHLMISGKDYKENILFSLCYVNMEPRTVCVYRYGKALTELMSVGWVRHVCA